MARLLIDTFYVYQLMSSPRDLTPGETAALSDPRAELFVSAASIWEMRIKYNARHRSGARKSRFDPKGVLAALEDGGVQLLAVTAHHAATSLDAPIAHKDTFDELLLAQAQEEGLKLLTRDEALLAHPLAIGA